VGKGRVAFLLNGIICQHQFIGNHQNNPPVVYLPKFKRLQAVKYA
jgi:hypothetical protein